MIEVLLYSKPGCQLCGAVKAKLEALRRERVFALREINILEDPAALTRFKEEIPVVFINGRKAFKYFLKESEFLERLEQIDKMTRNHDAA